MPGAVAAGTTILTATLRVCLGLRAPPVLSEAKPTLAIRGAIAPLGVNETLSVAGAEEVMRKTSDQLVELATTRSPKSRARLPCLSEVAIGVCWGQPVGE